MVNSNELPQFAVLLTGGYGYQNVGDEAQLGANLERWRKLRPDAQLTVLSPNPGYTQSLHGVNADIAPRVVWFKANQRSDYGLSTERFQQQFWRVRRRLLLAAKLLRAGWPPALATRSEARLLRLIARANVLHVSGGGFLTGMTRSRLWENCLLMELCNSLDTPVILSGQTIGVFKSEKDRWLATKGLQTARLIYLRDSGTSELDLQNLGIEGDHVVSLFDDALFCSRCATETTTETLEQHGIYPKESFATVNFHYWGMTESIKKKARQRFAEMCAYLMGTHKLKLLFLPMAPSDEVALQELNKELPTGVQILRYGYDYRIARGVIAQSELVLTMKHHPIIFAHGECVPALSVALDDYYSRKNFGALENCNQERFSLDAETFFLPEASRRLDELIANRRELQGQLRDYLGCQVPRSTEVIDRFLSAEGSLATNLGIRKHE